MACFLITTVFKHAFLAPTRYHDIILASPFCMMIPASEWKLFFTCNKFGASLAGRVTSKDEFSTLHNVTIASYWTTHPRGLLLPWMVTGRIPRLLRTLVCGQWVAGSSNSNRTLNLRGFLRCGNADVEKVSTWLGCAIPDTTRGVYSVSRTK